MASPVSPDPDKLDALTGRGKDPQPQNEPPEGKFEGHMKDGGETNPLQKGNVPSPMDIANQQKVSPSTPPTMDKVHAQMNAVSGSLGDIKNKLNTKGLKLKNSEKYLVRKKLGNANEHIDGVAKKMGLDSKDFTKKLNQSKNPIAKFLSMVSDGQQQMVEAGNTIKHLNSNGKKMQPGDLLLVQIKLNKAQQELNYTSVILGNATSMIKTLFNIQI